MEPFDPDQRNLVRSPLDNENILSGQFWGELRVFLAVAKAKSFNRAAEVLNTSQPTVSRQVRRLQDLMGSQLFVPTQNGVKLTAKGQALAQSLTQLDHSLFALTNDLKAEAKEAEGIVRVCITDGLNTFFVAPALAAFSSEHPKIQLHLKESTNLVSLRENQTDLMIGFSAMEGADITARKLGHLHFIPVVTKTYIQQYGIPTRSNLKHHLFVQSEFYAAKTGLWNSWNGRSIKAALSISAITRWHMACSSGRSRHRAARKLHHPRTRCRAIGIGRPYFRAGLCSSVDRTIELAAGWASV